MRLTLVLACILITLHLGAFSYRAVIGANETLDSIEYLQIAQNAANGLGFNSNTEGDAFSEEAVSRRPPGYPTMILAMGQSKIALFGLQTLFSLGTIWLCFLFVRRFTNSSASINFLLAGFIFTPSQVIYATSIMSEIPFQFFLTAGILSAILFFEKNKLHWILLSALAFSIGFTIKPILYPVAILFSVVALAFIAQKKQFRIIPVAILPALCVLVMACWNYSRTQVFEVSSIQTTNMLDVNMKLVLYQADGQERGDFVIDSLEKEADKIKSYKERQQFRSQQSRQIFLEHPIIATYQFAKGVALFFLDPGRFDFITYAGIDNKQGLMNALAAQDSGVIKKILLSTPLWLWLILVCVLVFNVCKVVFYTKFLIQNKENLASKILLSCGIAYIAFASGPLGLCRYALPVAPLILTGASLAFAKKDNVYL